ncbi:MAG: hypothetical protein WCJ87_03100 [Burkholderiales bacterium]
MRVLRWSLALLLLGVLSLVGLAGLIVYLGHTPGRLMDYAERRLEGHPKLESIALPVVGAVREALDEPSQRERHNRPLLIPAPPPPTRLVEQAGSGSRGDAPAGRILRVGPSEAIRTIAQASRIAKDGDTVEIVAGDYRGDVALWLQKRLVIRAVGGRARLYADGRSAEGKAIWVIRNGHFEVSGIDFIGARVNDRNGAGIRFEDGHLIVRDCLFWGNESGLLTSNSPESRLEIEGSEFAYKSEAAGQSHHLYAGSIASLRVSGSYFHHGNIGHLIKSRAAVNDIRYNRITDERGGHASYEVDLPDGGLAVLVGNVIEQGRYGENSTLVAFGREGYKHPENRLYLMSNTLVNDHPYGGAFLRAAPGATAIVSANNLLSGIGRYHSSVAAQVFNDVNGDASLFVDAANHDYRLSESGRRTRFQKPVASTYRGIDLEPRAEYVHPRSIRPLSGPPVYPGAVQSLSP